MNTLIESLGAYLPPRVLSTEEVLRGCARPLRFPLEKLTGIRSRRVGGDGDFSFDLARKAAIACLARSAFRPEEIDVVISCSISRCDGPDAAFTFEPSTAVRLAGELGLARARAFDISSACTGMFTGVLVADTLIKRGAARCALIVSGEHITPLLATAQKTITEFLDPRLACLTLGDAGAALVLAPSPSDTVGFHDIELFTMGAYASYCVAKATPDGPVMFTDSVKITEIAVLPAVQSAIEVVARNRAAFSSVEHVILHQTSRTSLRDAARVIDQAFPGTSVRANTIDNLAERGNTASTSHFVAAVDHIQNGRIATGDNVVFGISGSGQTVGTALYTFDDLPDRLREGRAASRSAADAAGRAAPGGPAPGVRIVSVGLAPREREARPASLELARAAAEDCLGRSARARADVGLILHAGVYRTECRLEPAEAATLAGALGVNDSYAVEGAGRKSLAFDVFNGGVGLLDACWVAVEMIRAGRVDAALLSASEVAADPDGRPEARRGVVETGSALLLERAPAGCGFGRFHARTFPEHVGALRVHANGAGGALVVARDPRLEDLYLRAIPPVVEELLALEGLPMSRVAVVLPPQISSSFVRRVADGLGVEVARCVDATVAGADLFTSSLPHAFRSAVEAGRVAPGDLGLVIAVGSGIQVVCALYRF